MLGYYEATIQKVRPVNGYTDKIITGNNHNRKPYPLYAMFAYSFTMTPWTL